MHRSLALATTLAVLLTASALLVPGGSHAAPQRSAGPDVLPSIPSVAIAAADSGGGEPTTFEVGLQSGQIYFTSIDTSGDATATVTINDHNATRDHVSMPAASWTVKFHGGATNDSWAYGVFYLLPVNLTYGGQWNITIAGTAGGFAYENFTVETYELESVLSPANNLPAHNASAAYATFLTANRGLYGALTNVEVTGDYLTSTSTLSRLPNTPASLGSAGVGWYNFTIPTNAAGGYTLDFFANTTSDGGNSSAESSSSGYIGHIGTPSVLLSSCPGDCYTSSFPAGAPVYVYVHDLISGTFSGPAAGLTATFRFEQGASFVNAPGNPPSALTTDASGSASLSFLAQAPPFTTQGLNTVSVTMSDPLDPSDTSVTTNATFTIYNATSTPSVAVAFQDSEYFSGDTATVQWAIGGGNATAVHGWSGDYWAAATTGDSVLDLAALPTGSTSGTFEIHIPSTFTGRLIAEVAIDNATDAVLGISETDVEVPSIFLTPSETYYLPGDTINVQVTTESQALANVPLHATVTDSAGNWVFNGNLTSSKVQISVPSTDAPTSYSVTVYAQSSTTGLVANATVALYEANGVDLTLSVTSSSNYVDGSFQPGQTVTVAYTFVPRGLATLPKTFVIQLSPSTSDSGLDSETVTTTSASGTFQYTIPSNAGNGVLFVEAYATLGGPTCLANCSSYGQFSVDVNNNPSSLSYQLGNSGVTIAWVVLLVVVFVVALLTILFVRRGGKTMVMRPESGGSNASTSSSTSGPSSSGGPGGSA